MLFGPACHQQLNPHTVSLTAQIAQLAWPNHMGCLHSLKVSPFKNIKSLLKQPLTSTYNHALVSGFFIYDLLWYSVVHLYNFYSQYYCLELPRIPLKTLYSNLASILFHKIIKKATLTEIIVFENKAEPPWCDTDSPARSFGSRGIQSATVYYQLSMEPDFCSPALTCNINLEVEWEQLAKIKQGPLASHQWLE